MNKLVTLLFALMITFGSSQAFAAETDLKRSVPEGITNEQLSQMEQKRNEFEKRLNITPEQRAKIKAIQAQAKADMEKIAADATKKIEAVYTPAQKAELTAIKKEKELQDAKTTPVSLTNSAACTPCKCSKNCTCGMDCECKEGKRCNKDCTCNGKRK